MNCKKPFDVLIVGAGPAGSSAARAAAEEGARVVMLEKKMRIGEPVRCGEYVPRLLAQTVKIPPDAIAQKIRGMKTFMPDGEVLRRCAPGFILNRAKFDQALAADASKAGAKILTGTRAISREGNRVKILGRSGESEIKASVVIGADGPNSLVGLWIGQKNRSAIWAEQHTVMLKQPAEDTEVYFRKEYPGGYAWLFPKGDVANVGVGVLRELGGLAKEALKEFKEKIKDRIGEVIFVTAGPIPVGGPLRSIDRGARTILVGDAAGHTHPITGGGIPQAVIFGAMAGRAAAARANGDDRALQNYFQKWRHSVGSVMDRAVKKREKMEAGWNRGDLVELLHSCWIACREYYHED